MAYSNSFIGGSYSGALENEGVGLGTIAPDVPPALLTELKQVQAGIINGTILVTP